jgi:hypothetical protein
MYLQRNDADASRAAHEDEQTELSPAITLRYLISAFSETELRRIFADTHGTMPDAWHLFGGMGRR